MDSRQLRYFAAIYEKGTLLRASEDLRVAVSALSHHLSNLEHELGSPLFLRKHRGLQPTAAGERLYDHAKAILKAMTSAENDIRAGLADVSGEVSVGMAHSVVRGVALPLLHHVTAHFPRLKLFLSESLSGATLGHLLNGEVDLALIYNPPNDPRLAIQPILEERMVCIGTRDFLGDTDDPITFEDVLSLPLILLRQGVAARALLDNARLLRKLEEHARFQMNSVHAIIGSLLDGLGCLIGNHMFVQDHLDAGRLRARPIIEPDLTRTLYLCEVTNNPATFAREKIRSLIADQIADAVTSGRWNAELIGTPARPTAS